MSGTVPPLPGAMLLCSLPRERPLLHQPKHLLLPNQTSQKPNYLLFMGRFGRASAKFVIVFVVRKRSRSGK